MVPYTPTRRDCLVCVSPALPVTVSTQEHCLGNSLFKFFLDTYFTFSCTVACDSGCVGLMRCVSPGPSIATRSCCNYFDMTGNCVEACPANSSHNVQFECECEAGYEADGNTCVEINECESNPCHNGGICTDEVNGFSCTCAAGFTNDTCSTDIDDCNPDPCQNGGTCMDQVNGFSCICAAGFTDDICSTDIDECESDPCQNGGTCLNTPGSYTCVCRDFWEGLNCEVCGRENCLECVGAEARCVNCSSGYIPSPDGNCSELLIV